MQFPHRSLGIIDCTLLHPPVPARFSIAVFLRVGVIFPRGVQIDLAHRKCRPHRIYTHLFAAGLLIPSRIHPILMA